MALVCQYEKLIFHLACPPCLSHPIRYQIAVWGNAARQKHGWNKKLKYPSLVLWRIGLPIVWYFWISLMFSLLFKAFLIPTEAAFGHGECYQLGETHDEEQQAAIGVANADAYPWQRASWSCGCSTGSP